MENILIIQEKVKNTIILGESHFREFKTALEGKPGNKKPRLTKKICEDIGEALVSFANADGGELLIGVEDDGAITGIPHSEEDISVMLAATHTHIYHGQELPLSASTKLNIDGKIVLYFAVNKGTTQIYQLPDGRCVRRKDKSAYRVSRRIGGADGRARLPYTGAEGEPRQLAAHARHGSECGRRHRFRYSRRDFAVAVRMNPL